MTTVTEIERRFLLKKLPEWPGFTDISIHQFYVKEGEEVFRYRKIIYPDFQQVIYEKIIKKNISKGINEETKFEITAEEYEAAASSDNNEVIGFIRKDRHVYREEDSGPFFEVDVFKRKTPLIIMEVELSSLDQQFTIPSYLQELIEKEITGDPAYSNFNLSQDGQNL